MYVLILAYYLTAPTDGQHVRLRVFDQRFTTQQDCKTFADLILSQSNQETRNSYTSFQCLDVKGLKQWP